MPSKGQIHILGLTLLGIALAFSLTGGSPMHASAQTTSVVFAGAGDISTCGNDNDAKTAQLLGQIAPRFVFTVGDNVYQNGTYSEFMNCYNPTWGKYKSFTKPVRGNHDYNTAGAQGFWDYFLYPAYYVYDIGTWRIYVLDTELDVSATSAQVQWLKNDLAAHPKSCVLAFWHRPRWSSGSAHGSDSKMQTIWQVLYNAKAELVINGHEHNYERFAQMNAYGQAVSSGLREIIAGTGGVSHSGFGTILSSSRVRNSNTYGVLRLNLRSGGYDWKFVPIAGQSFTDSGSTSCH